MKFIKYITLVSLFGVSACVEQMVMIPENPTIDTERVVLLEELTGVDCPNCPKGALAAKEIQANFPGQIVVVAIHGEFLAEPLSTSNYDFRFPEAEDLENYLKPWDGKPAAAINRTEVEGSSEFSETNTDLWQGIVEDELAKTHVLNLIADVNYNPDTRTVQVNTAGNPLVNLEGDYNITVMLTENHIIDAQKNVSVIIDDYEHEHVLRMFLTPFDGTFFGSNLGAGELYNNGFSGTLPDEDGTWIAENMEVVVLVHRVDGSHKEVMQAFITDVTE